MNKFSNNILPRDKNLLNIKVVLNIYVFNLNYMNKLISGHPSQQTIPQTWTVDSVLDFVSVLLGLYNKDIFLLRTGFPNLSGALIRQVMYKHFGHTKQYLGGTIQEQDKHLHQIWV